MRWERISFLFAVLALLFVTPQSANAQYYGGYGAGFQPSPQALYNPYTGAVVGVMPPVYYGGFGMGYGGYPMMGGGYGGYGGRMSVSQALMTAAVITSWQNNNYGYGGGYGYQQPYGYGNGYGHRRHHHHHRHHH